MESPCFNFLDHQNNTVLGWDFTIDDIVFKGLGRNEPNAFPPFVNEGWDVKGLQFSDNGIEIRLPTAVSEVSLDVASFTPRPLEITAYDSQGNSVAKMTIPGNSRDFVRLVGDNITSITITGGGGEGILFELCGNKDSSSEDAHPVTYDTSKDGQPSSSDDGSDEPESPTEPIAHEPNRQCLDFQPYLDDTVLGWDFTIDDIVFKGLGRNEPYAFPPFVNESGDVKGLQFSDNGIEIRLPTAVSEVSLDVASFTPRPLEITAYDSQGNIVAQVTISGDNDIHSISLVGENIMSITVTGGGGEGVLFELCSYAVKIKYLIDEHLNLDKAKETLEDLLDPDNMPEDVREIINTIDLDLDSYIEKALQDLIDYYDRPLEDILNDPNLNDFENILKEIEMEQGGSGEGNGKGSGSRNGISLGGGGFGLNFKIDWKFLRCLFRNLARKAFIGWLTDWLTRIDPIPAVKEKLLSWAAAKLGITVALLEKAMFWVSIGKSIYDAWFLCHKERKSLAAIQ